MVCSFPELLVAVASIGDVPDADLLIAIDPIANAPGSKNINYSARENTVFIIERHWANLAGCINGVGQYRTMPLQRVLTAFTATYVGYEPFLTPAWTNAFGALAASVL